MKISEYIYKYCVRHREAEERSFPGWDKVRRILLIYESNVLEKNPEISAIAARLRHEGMDVTLWGYVDKPQAMAAILPMSRILGRKNLTWYGRPKKEVLADLRKQQYDLLLDLSLPKQPEGLYPLPLRYLSLYADVAFRAGCEGTRSDLQIRLPKEAPVQQLYEQIERYLQIIH